MVIAMVVLVIMLFGAGTWILKCCLVSFHLFFPFLLVLAVVSMLRLRSPMMLAASVMTKLGKLNYPYRNFVGKTCDSVQTPSSPFIHLCPLALSTYCGPHWNTSPKITFHWPLGICDGYEKYSITLCFHSPSLNNHLTIIVGRTGTLFQFYASRLRNISNNKTHEICLVFFLH